MYQAEVTTSRATWDTHIVRVSGVLANLGSPHGLDYQGDGLGEPRHLGAQLVLQATVLCWARIVPSQQSSGPVQSSGKAVQWSNEHFS